MFSRTVLSLSGLAAILAASIVVLIAGAGELLGRAGGGIPSSSQQESLWEELKLEQHQQPHLQEGHMQLRRSPSQTQQMLKVTWSTEQEVVV